MKKELNINVVVNALEGLDPQKVAQALELLIQSGFADAIATVEDEGNMAEEQVLLSKAALDLELVSISPAKPPRVLVTIDNGLADYVADPGVVVEVFDHGDYEFDPKSVSGVSKHFEDLAQPLGIPVQNS